MTEAPPRTGQPAGQEGSEQARLVAQAASFAEAFVRWMESNACDGLSYPRLRLLESLHCRGPAIMRDLAEQIGLSARNMTVTIDSLEQEGLVSRRPHPTDRRATLIELTPAGQKAADTVVTPRVEAIATLFEDLTPKSREQFLQATATLLEGLRSRGVRV